MEPNRLITDPPFTGTRDRFKLTTIGGVWHFAELEDTMSNTSSILTQDELRELIYLLMGFVKE